MGRQCYVCLPNTPSLLPDLRFWITGKMVRWRYCRVQPVLHDMYFHIKRCSYENEYMFEYSVSMFHIFCAIIYVLFHSIPKVLFCQNNMNLKSIDQLFKSVDNDNVISCLKSLWKGVRLHTSLSITPFKIVVLTLYNVPFG